jgi:hypothetical protein
MKEKRLPLWPASEKNVVFAYRYVEFGKVQK